MKVKTVSQTLIDVFHGTGWMNWSRWDTSGKIPVQVAGVVVPDQVRSIIIRRNSHNGGK